MAEIQRTDIAPEDRREAEKSPGWATASDAERFRLLQAAVLLRWAAGAATNPRQQR